MLTREVRGPIFEIIMEGGFERKTDQNVWLQHSEMGERGKR